MPVLSFPCITHRLERGSPTYRRTWIKGHDLRALALAATAQLSASEQYCRYGIAWPERAPASVFLEVEHADGDALVGPMAGPVPSSDLPLDLHVDLESLLVMLGFDPPDASSHARSSSRYEVTVTYLPIWQRASFPPAQGERQNDPEHRVERIHVDRARHQGIHLISYEAPPESWTAHDLERLMQLAYRLLPSQEPQWRESGAITPARFAAASATGAQRITTAPSLQVGRGDYVAHLRLPAFPTRALVEWLESRQYDINLRHPVIKLGLAPRERGADNQLTGKV